MREEIKSFLLNNSDIKYRDFAKNLKISNKNKKQLGVRIPILRSYAKKLSKEYELKYLLEIIDEEYYEEILLKGFIIGNYPKLSFDELKHGINYFLPRITDWSICDTFVSSLKITKKYQRELWEEILKYIKSSKPFTVRFALVMLLNYYLDDHFIDDVLKLISDVNLDHYYVKMATAWLLSYCFIKYYDKTLDFFLNSLTIDQETKKMTIRKCIDSYKITDRQKQELRQLDGDKR